MENLYGSIIKVTYFNEENGYGIVRIKLNYQDNKIAKYQAKLFSNRLTVLCSFDRLPIEDEEYDFIGEFVNSPYGIQFKATSFSRRNNETLEGVVTYLSSSLFKGIGKTIASNIFNTLGSKCLELIRNDKSVLDKVEGLKQETKDTIYNSLIENMTKEEMFVELTKMGITMTMATKLIGTLKDNAVSIVKKNPYQLMDLIEGIGFQKADKIAMNIGIKKNDIIRLQALVTYFIKNSSYSSGDTYITYESLAMKINAELSKNGESIDRTILADIIDDLVKDGKIFVDEEKNVYEINTYNSENSFALRMVELLKNELLDDFSDEQIDVALKAIMKQNKITYNSLQEEAITTALKENVMIITGGPGTGKSTIIKAIIDAYVMLHGDENIREDIALLAPTGRASKRLNEVTKHPSSTIHRFLGYDGGNRFRHGPKNPVFARMVIIDEMSMVDILLAARLVLSLPKEVKIIFVGDNDQLPSVGPGEVLANLIFSKEIAVVKLDKIHRQAADSTIISLAHEVNNGQLPENIMERQNDRNFIPLADEIIIDNIIKVLEQGLSKEMDIIKDIQVLVPIYKGELGINAINSRLQEHFNPFVDYELTHLARRFRVNDKVIQLVNRSEKGVMNGDIGYVLTLDIDNDIAFGLTVMFDNGPVYYNKDELEDLTHAYAISIHKSQGSEFSLVVIPFTKKYFIMLKRKLIYTAITRAKKYLIMLGDIEALNTGTKQVEFNRKTRLVNKIKDAISGKLIISPYDFLD